MYRLHAHAVIWLVGQVSVGLGATAQRLLPQMVGRRVRESQNGLTGLRHRGFEGRGSGSEEDEYLKSLKTQRARSWKEEMFHQACS